MPPLTMSSIRPLRIVGGRNAASGVMRLELDQKAVARAHALMDRYRDKPLYTRMQKASLAAAKLIEGPMRAATPVSSDETPGVMRRRTRARSAKVRTSYVIGKGWRSKASTEALVGPITPYSHLVIRGHRIVTLRGVDTGRRTRANPYVDVVAARMAPRAIAEMRRHIFQAGAGGLL